MVLLLWEMKSVKPGLSPNHVFFHALRDFRHVFSLYQHTGSSPLSVRTLSPFHFFRLFLQRLTLKRFTRFLLKWLEDCSVRYGKKCLTFCLIERKGLRSVEVLLACEGKRVECVVTEIYFKGFLRISLLTFTSRYFYRGAFEDASGFIYEIPLYCHHDENKKNFQFSSYIFSVQLVHFHNCAFFSSGKKAPSQIPGIIKKFIMTKTAKNLN